LDGNAALIDDVLGGSFGGGGVGREYADPNAADPFAAAFAASAGVGGGGEAGSTAVFAPATVAGGGAAEGRVTALADADAAKPKRRRSIGKAKPKRPPPRQTKAQAAAQARAIAASVAIDAAAAARAATMSLAAAAGQVDAGARAPRSRQAALPRGPATPARAQGRAHTEHARGQHRRLQQAALGPEAQAALAEAESQARVRAASLYNAPPTSPPAVDAHARTWAESGPDTHADAQNAQRAEAVAAGAHTMAGAERRARGRASGCAKAEPPSQMMSALNGGLGAMDVGGCDDLVLPAPFDAGSKSPWSDLGVGFNGAVGSVDLPTAGVARAAPGDGLAGVDGQDGACLGEGDVMGDGMLDVDEYLKQWQV
jgi:hypothetical protein